MKRKNMVGLIAIVAIAAAEKGRFGISPKGGSCDL